MQLNKGIVKLISGMHLIMHNFKRPLILLELVFVSTSTMQVFAQTIPLKTQIKDTLKQIPSTNERVVRVFLIEDRNPIKQVLNFDFSYVKKQNDSVYFTNCATHSDTISNPTLEHLQEVFQMVFSGSADFVLKIDSVVLSKQTKILINDAMKNPLRWKNLDKNAIGGGIFIKKDPE